MSTIPKANPLKILFIYLFLVTLGFRCCARAFSSCGQRGLLFVVVCGLLIALASFVAEHGLQVRRLSSCGSWALECRLSSCGALAQLLRGMWSLPGPGHELVSPALAGRFLTTAPPGKSKKTLFKRISQVQKWRDNRCLTCPWVQRRGILPAF